MPPRICPEFAICCLVQYAFPTCSIELSTRKHVLPSFHRNTAFACLPAISFLFLCIKKMISQFLNLVMSSFMAVYKTQAISLKIGILNSKMPPKFFMISCGRPFRSCLPAAQQVVDTYQLVLVCITSCCERREDNDARREHNYFFLLLYYLLHIYNYICKSRDPS